MTVYPNVKINLGLRVLEKRPDGFHNLETMFLPFDGLSDVLTVEEAPKFSVHIDKCGWNPMEDLTVKAYSLLKDDFNLPPVKIDLKKKAPVGAGLGGGSSDGAFMLCLLNEMFSLSLSKITLSKYAAQLGSDCAFFIYNEPMIGTGRGNVLSPYDIDLSDYEVELRVPDDVSVSTADAYRGIQPYKDGFSVREALSRPVEEWKDCLVNDFEATVFAKYPSLKQMKEELYADGAVYASMSGSGSSLFGLFRK